MEVLRIDLKDFDNYNHKAEREFKLRIRILMFKIKKVENLFGFCVFAKKIYRI